MSKFTVNQEQVVLHRREYDQLLREIESLREKLELASKDSEKLERLSSLARVAASAMHDIRNSLGIISSTAQLNLSKFSPQTRDKQAWETIEQSVETIRNILKAYQSMTRQMEDTQELVLLNEDRQHSVAAKL